MFLNAFFYNKYDEPVSVSIFLFQLVSDPSNFIAASLLSLTIMLQLELPHINVLSKVNALQLKQRLTMIRISTRSSSIHEGGSNTFSGRPFGAVW
jgi:hypothetical protein